MKKLSLYALFCTIALMLGACSSDDFTDWTSPQSMSEDPADAAITIPGFTAMASATPVDLATNVGQDVALFTFNEASLPAGYSLGNVRLMLTPADETAAKDLTTVELEATADGKVDSTALANAIVNAYGKRPTARPFKAKVYAGAVKNGESIFIDAGEILLNMAPKAPHISANYYVVGGTLDWAGSAASKEQKFSHSDADIYDDPVFTIVINAAGGDTWFAIGDDEACDAIANNEDGAWSKLLGTTKGNGNTDLTGTLDYRYNLSDDGSFCVPAGNTLIKISIDMMEYSYTIEPMNIASEYYLVGGSMDWKTSAVEKAQKFSHSDKSVADDPVFTYLMESTGSEMWFAFGDATACEAIANDDWSKLFGTKGDSKDLSGSFDYRYNLDGDHSFCVDGTAKYYQISINAKEFTYEITPLNFSQYVYFIGATDGWQAADQKLALVDDKGIYTGYLYVADPNGWGLEFKFQKVAGSWDDQINSNTLAEITGDFEKGGDNIKAAAGEGVYYVTLDLGANTLNAVKVNKMGIIGDFNSWGGDVEMTWNATDFCFEATNAGVTAAGWKFRINSDWGINLGANDSVEPSTVIGDLCANGKNLGVAGSTVKLYPTRKTSDKIFCTVE